MVLCCPMYRRRKAKSGGPSGVGLSLGSVAMKPHTAQKRNTRKLRNVGNRHGGSSAVTVGILGVAPIKIPDFDTEETARTQESSASGSTQESSAPGPQLAGSMSRTRTWVSVGVDAGFSELLETSPPSSLTLATSGSFSPRNDHAHSSTRPHEEWKYNGVILAEKHKHEADARGKKRARSE